MPFVPFSELTHSDADAARRVIGGRAVFQLYFEAAIESLPQNTGNRQILIGTGGQGVSLSIDFEGTTIRSTVGELHESELTEVVAVSGRAELHLEPAHLGFVRTRLATRISSVRQLRYYRLNAPTGLTVDPRCRLLGPADETVLAEFFQRHYPSTIFSAWMLHQPFVGLFEGAELRACGGVVASSRTLHSANLGNFLTDPQYRGGGLAKSVAGTLIHFLEENGLRTFLLGATEDNVSAWRAYERIGFRIIETRPQVDVRKP